MNKLSTIYIVLLALFVLLLVGCTNSDMTDSAEAHQAEKQEAVTFDSYLQRTTEGNGATRTTYPATNGQMDNNKLKQSGFGVFAQYAGSTNWMSYTDKATTPFNFMWNQQVGWNAGSTAWTYSPVKYWPNDNNPADNNGATGSQEHSYLNFFAYAPYVEVVPSTGALTPTAATASDDGIVAITTNATNAAGSYLTYRTSATAPFDPDENVDLLWAVQTDRYKTDAAGYGYVNGTVDLQFKHALTRVGFYVKALIDRTKDHTSEAYSDELDVNTRIFITSVNVTMPDFYSEGHLMLTPADAALTVPRWDFEGLDAKKNGELVFDNDASNATPDVRYAIRYAAPNVPQNRNWDGQDAGTDLYDYEQAKEDFDAMEPGVTNVEQQLAATQAEFMFPPSATTKDLTVRMVYHVITYDKNLVLNSPKYYSNVTNDVTASLGSAFKWEPGKKYKILLEPGLTSAKFTLAEITEWGEVIILSSVVKEWDVVTKEVDIN